MAGHGRSTGLRAAIKLNTVVTSLTAHEDMSDFVRAVAPERWKIFQVLPVEGQNDGSVEPLLIDDAAFRAFVARHARLEADGVTLVPEDNDGMTDSYAMIDPLGRFYGNHRGRYVYSRPILEVGVREALGQVNFEVKRLIQRGGLYTW